MRRRGGNATLAIGLALTLIQMVAVGAWACVPMANMEVTPKHVQAGQEVTVSGIRFVSFEPVIIRLNSLDGPILATVPMGPTANTLFKTSVTIPPGTPAGPAVLIATQDPTPGYVAVAWGIPSRSVVTVTGADGATAPSHPIEVVDRPAGLARTSAATGAIVLVALGVATAALLIAGVAAFTAGRRTAHREPVPQVSR